jgi:hypothetical protein
VVAGLWHDQWGRQDVVLWLWLATAAAASISSKRAAMVALEDRARRAEETREETARRRVAEDRVRIARELHDVIAHHVAVMSVQSGVAEHLVERDPAAAREALHRVRAAAKSVLSELQSVLGVLRQDESILPTTPAPGLGDLPGLVESFRAMGASVELVVPERTPPERPRRSRGTSTATRSSSPSPTPAHPASTRTACVRRRSVRVSAWSGCANGSWRPGAPCPVVPPHKAGSV